MRFPLDIKGVHIFFHTKSEANKNSEYKVVFVLISGIGAQIFEEEYANITN